MPYPNHDNTFHSRWPPFDYRRQYSYIQFQNTKSRENSDSKVFQKKYSHGSRLIQIKMMILWHIFYNRGIAVAANYYFMIFSG